MILNYIKLIRIKHWIKNFFVFAPLIFTLQFTDAPSLYNCLYAFLAFCLLSSFVYIVNDSLDREKDKNHPTKKHRPIASGKVSIRQATPLSAALLISVIALSYFTLNLPTILVLTGYLILNIVYSLRLKHWVIIDVLLIAIGFILRILAGATAIAVPVTHWMLLTAFFISLFLGYGKRRAELITATKHASFSFRKVLEKYNLDAINFYLLITATLTLVCYSLYTIAPDTIEKTGTDKLIYTVPFVVFGIFRYILLLFENKEQGDPADLILKDKPIQIICVAWLLTVMTILIFAT